MYADLIEQAARELPLTAIRTPWTEYAWSFADFPELLRFFREKAWTVLGGDILTTELAYTCDNWYYNPDPAYSPQENVLRSIAAAEDHLTACRERNGTDYMIVFVVTRRFP